MKVYISFDFEGIAGVSFWKETEGDFRWNNLATKQLKAFIEGILSKNPDAEIVVSDSHAYGESLLWENLDKVKLIRGWPRVFYMVEGLDNSFTDLVLFGYHTAIGGDGMMDHSYSSSSIYSIKMNGEYLDEARINTYYASELGVPLSFIYGDKQTVQSSPGYPDIDYCISKEAISRFCGLMRPESEILDELYLKGQNLGKNKKIIKPKPYVQKSQSNDIEKTNKNQSNILDILSQKIYPLFIEMEFTDTVRAKLASILPYVNLVSQRKIEFECENVSVFYRLLNAITIICAAAKTVR